MARTMRVFIALSLAVLGIAQAVKAPTSITDCQTINKAGNYVLSNDLVLDAVNQHEGAGGDCLTVKSSHVNVDMQGWTIMVVCPPYLYCPVGNGVVGGIGIHILNHAHHASISNGAIGGSGVAFVYGLVDEANHTSVSNLGVNAIVGVTLSNSSYGHFENIAYTGADQRSHSSNGPILSISGGGHNHFEGVTGNFLGGDLSSVSGMVISGSNHNKISDATFDLFDGKFGGAGILVTQNSAHNSIYNNHVSVLSGDGIEVDLGSQRNKIQENGVSIASPPTEFAMFDQNPGCDSNSWADNSFGNIFAPTVISANPADCIN
jgi:hypothetical protein